MQINKIKLSRSSLIFSFLLININNTYSSDQNLRRQNFFNKNSNSKAVILSRARENDDSGALNFCTQKKDSTDKKYEITTKTQRSPEDILPLFNKYIRTGNAEEMESLFAGLPKEVIKKLLSTQYGNGFNPLISVVVNRYIELAKFLLDNGADEYINTENDYGLKPIRHAFKNKDLRMCQLLIKGGANLDIKMSNGFTLLHSLVKNKDLEKVELVLSIEGDKSVNIPDDLDFTPLITAVKNKDIPMIRLLLDHGAIKSIDHKNKDGYTAMSRALEGKDLEIINILKLAIEKYRLDKNNDCKDDC